MKNLIAFLTILISMNRAHALQAEAWELGKAELTRSVLTRADGSQVTMNPQDEMVLTLNLKTAREYGSSQSREVLQNQVTPAKDGRDGVIELRLESALQQSCNRDRDGISFPAVGKHYARVSSVLKPGRYEVRINGDAWATAEITAEGATVTPVEAYTGAVALRYHEEAVAVFGDPSTYEKQGKTCSAKVSFQDGKWIASFRFARQEINLPNGDLLIKKELEKSVELSFHPRPMGCPGNRELTWTGTFRNAELGDVVTVQAWNGKRTLTFALGDRRCE